MVDVCPLQGWRYDVSQVGDLSDVTCPPYDVIDDDLQTALYKKHPCNAVRLEFNRAEPGDASPDDRYRRAAGFWKHWRIDGVLRQEADDTLYVYHQEFRVGEETFLRKGFLGRLRLEEFGSGQVFPHEQTLSGPKADRLKLFEACRANLSPIFGLYSDPELDAQRRLDDACLTITPIQATDPDGVIHRLWRVTDNTIIQAVRAHLRDKPVYIADGHHRYETGLKYRNQLAAEGRLPELASPAQFILAYLVAMQDEGLQVLPTHRLLTGLPLITTSELRKALESHFELEWMGLGEQGACDTWDMVTADGSQAAFGFGSASDGGWLYARLTDDTQMAELAPTQSLEWRELAVSRLHRLVLETLLPRAFPDFAPQFRYVHEWEQVSHALKNGEAQLGCLIPPASVDHVEAIAGQRETMPPKSTYFYPKLLTGMVMYGLE